MKMKLIIVIVSLSLLLTGISVGIAETTEDAEIVCSSEESEATVPETGTDLLLGETPDLTAAPADDSLLIDVALPNDEEETGNADESSENSVELTIVYTGKELSKVYDKTRNIIDYSGKWLLDKSLSKSDFEIRGLLDGYKDVRISKISITRFDGVDAKKYDLQASFALTGEDAPRYKAKSTTIPARINKRPVVITPTPGLSKSYGEPDPTNLGLYCTAPGRLALTEEEKAAGKKDFTGRMTREQGEKPGKYKFLRGDLDFDNDNYDVSMKEEYFTINPMDVGSDGVAMGTIGSQRYTGSKIKPTVTLKNVKNNEILKEGMDYTIRYSDNVKPGTATIKITGKGNYIGTKVIIFEILEITVPIDDQNISVSTIKDQVYTGKAIKPSIVVKHNGKKLKAGTDYKLTYKNNKKIGIATVTITGKGNYKGSRQIRFNIVPKGTTISTATGGKKHITIKWEKGSGITGYQLEYSLKKSFAAGNLQTIDSAKQTKQIVRGLKSKKTYYCRIRTYKDVNGMIFASAWSKVKKVTTK